MDSKKVLVVGAGLGGLMTAYLMSNKKYQVEVVEKNNEIGGLLANFKIEGSNLEKSYHHFFKTDSELLVLIKELGLSNKIVWNKSSVAVYSNKRMQSFLSASDLLKFKGLSLVDKFRMGLVALYLSYDKDWEKYKKVKAYKWMKNKVGEKAYKVIWEPLLKGKFGKDYQKISMSWLWARINTRGNSKDNSGKEVLGYLDGGLVQIVEKLKEKIIKNGGKIILNKEIACLRQARKDYDLIIDTRPVQKIDYIGAITVVFSSEQNLSSYYWHNINDPKSPFLAFIQHSNFMDKKKYNNKHIYYLGNYLDHKDKAFKMSDKEIKDEWLKYLKKIYPDFDKKKISQIKVFKFKNAQHLVDTNYKVPKYKIDSKKYRLNFAQIYPQDRGMNFAIREAKKLVKIINADS